MTPRLILASTSPRRRDLLAGAGYLFEVVAPDDDAEDAPREGEPPAELVVRLARQKAENVAAKLAADRVARSWVVLGADTVAACGPEVLGKPTDADHARRMLTTLRGRRHLVLTGYCLVGVPDGRRETGVATTTLTMADVPDATIDEHLAGGRWRGKAGGFGLQDGNDWLAIDEGLASNVVGLPVEEIADRLTAWGVGRAR